MTQHMVRKGATYWIRLRIPKALAARLGVAELNRSLRTVQPEVGRVRCLKATVWFRETMAMLSNMPAPTRADLQASAQKFFEALVEEIDQPRNFHPDNFDELVAWNLEETTNRIRELDGQLKANDFHGTVRKRANEIVASAGGIWKDMTERETLFALQLSARAEREQLELLRHELTHPASRFVPVDPHFRRESIHAPLEEKQTLQTPAPSGDETGTKLDTAVRLYLVKKEARNLSRSNVDEIGRVLRWLMEQLTPSRSLDAVQKEEMREFRTDVARMDRTQRGRRAPFKDRLTDNDADQIASVTALKYWRYVQAFFAWAFAEGHCKADPSVGLVLEAKKG